MFRAQIYFYWPIHSITFRFSYCFTVMRTSVSVVIDMAVSFMYRKMVNAIIFPHVSRRINTSNYFQTAVLALHSITLSGNRKVTTNVPLLRHSRLTQYLNSGPTNLLAPLNGLPFSLFTQSSHILTSMSIPLHLTSPNSCLLYIFLQLVLTLCAPGLVCVLHANGSGDAQVAKFRMG